jgi:hypothetical protein
MSCGTRQFEALVKERTKDFVGRDHVFQAIYLVSPTSTRLIAV